MVWAVEALAAVHHERRARIVHEAPDLSSGVRGFSTTVRGKRSNRAPFSLAFVAILLGWKVYCDGHALDAAVL